MATRPLEARPAHEIFRRPAVMNREDRMISLEVNPEARAIDVKAAVEELFKVKVDMVKFTGAPKAKPTARSRTKKRDWHKAYVRLKEQSSLAKFLIVEAKAPPRRYAASDFVPVPADDVAALVQVIRDGLSVNALERFHAESSLAIPEIAKLISLAPRTLARRREEGRLSAEESDRLVRISWLFAAASNLFGSVEAAREWLSKPATALGGLIPLDIAETEAGSREVERLIQQLEHGVFP